MKTASKMIPLGTQAPSFQLPNTLDDTIYNFDNIKDKKAYVVMFICNHCPFVIHLHDGLQSLYNDYKDKEVELIAISSNDVNNYPADSPKLMKSLFNRLELDFPYLYDETQEIAKKFKAACTPDFYVFDDTKKCTYRGQFDDSRPHSETPVTGEDLRNAIDDCLNNKISLREQKPSIGCNIKWK